MKTKKTKVANKIAGLNEAVNKATAFALAGAMIVSSIEAMAQNEIPSDPLPNRIEAAKEVGVASSDTVQSPSLGTKMAMGITVVYFGNKLHSLSKRHKELAKAYEKGFSQTVMSGHGAEMRPSVTLTDSVLRNTVPGDVISIEYGVRTVEALDHAVVSLIDNQIAWGKRVSQLETSRESLIEDLQEKKRIWNESKVKTVTALSAIERLQADLRSLDLVLSDARARLASVRSRFATARDMLKWYRSAPQGFRLSTTSFPVVYDVLVDEKAPARLRGFFEVNAGHIPATEADRAIPHIRIVRVHSSNLDMSSRMARSARASLAGVVIMGGLLVEEIWVGKLGQKLETLANEHYHPALRTEPKAE